MTDNRTTELLCKLLEECGVKYKSHYLHTSWYVGAKLYMATDDMNGTLTVDNLTPEQAIAATLGGGTLTAEHVRNAVRGHYKLRMVLDADGMDAPQVMFDWQAIADELNAEMRKAVKR